MQAASGDSEEVKLINVFEADATWLVISPWAKVCARAAEVGRDLLALDHDRQDLHVDIRERSSKRLDPAAHQLHLFRCRSDDGNYYATLAHARAHQRRRSPKPFTLLEHPELCRQIEAWMDDGWSPRLMAAMLAIEFPDDETMRVSHETIYQALYVQTRGQLRKDLAKQLSTKRAKRKPRGSLEPRQRLYRDALKISERPPEAADRAVPGHWEGDLIIGSGSSAIGTLVERRTRFTILLHLPQTHTADEVAAEMIKQMGKLPAHLRRSITWDRGSELAAYERIQLDLSTKVFFADPHSPWQRGTNENTNRLLRHWFEKGSDLRTWDAAGLQRVQDTLNRRPRPTLELQTPAQALNKLLERAATTPSVAPTS